MIAPIGTTRAPGGAGWRILTGKLAEPEANSPATLFSAITSFSDRAKMKQGRPAGTLTLGTISQARPSAVPVAPMGPERRAVATVIHAPAAPAYIAASPSTLPRRSVVASRATTIPRFNPIADGTDATKQVVGAGGTWGYVDPLLARKTTAALVAGSGAAAPADPGATVTPAPASKYIIPAAIAAAVLFVVL